MLGGNIFMFASDNKMVCMTAKLPTVPRGFTDGTLERCDQCSYTFRNDLPNRGPCRRQGNQLCHQIFSWEGLELELFEYPVLQCCV